jgi:hypothetical protein
VDEVHREELLDAAPEPGCVVEQARTVRPLLVDDAEGLLYVLP